MKILVLNSGSSSLKFQLIEASAEQITAATDRLLAKGEIEKIGSSEALLTFAVPGGERTRFTQPVPNHQQAIDAALKWLKGAAHEVEAVGHRIVHGGEFFHQSVRIDADVLIQIESCIDLAPLHNPHNLKGYYAVRNLLGEIPQVAVFDTALHRGLPLKARLLCDSVCALHAGPDPAVRVSRHVTPLCGVPVRADPREDGEGLQADQLPFGERVFAVRAGSWQVD